MDKVYETLSSCSAINNVMVLNKIKDESAFIDENQVELKKFIIAIEDLCITIRNEGYYALKSYFDKFNLLFYKNLCSILLNPSKSYESLSRLMCITLMPLLASDQFRKMEFIKSLLLYEGILMTINGLEPRFTVFRLAGILGREKDLDNY